MKESSVSQEQLNEIGRKIDLADKGKVSFTEIAEDNLNLPGKDQYFYGVILDKGLEFRA